MVGTGPGDGTSAATPLWASLGVQLNTIFADQGLPNLGYMNDLLYIAAAIKPDDEHFARTRLLALENTLGGRVLPMPYLAEATALARRHGLATHLDGARLFNAAVALAATDGGDARAQAKAMASHFDSVSVCFSKGLGAPVGSALVGSAELIARAHRLRKMLGGGMRQAGVLAAAGLYALAHNLPRLAEDHEHATALAAALAEIPGVTVVPPDTNIVLFDLAPPLPDADTVLKALAPRGVLGGAFGPRRVRLVTHLDVDAAACRRAAEQIRGLLCGA